MQNKTVGKYVDRYFASAWEQKGNFKLTDSRWGTSKQGGNVVSYFCTPEGRVIHFVAGPATPKELLEEMSWAVRAYSRATTASPTSLKRQLKTMSLLHKNSQPPLANSGWGSNKHKDAHHSSVQEIQDELDGTTPISVHRYLMYHPLPLLRDVEKDVFERYGDEYVRTEEDEKQLKTALSAIDRYREKGTPAVLFITQPAYDSSVSAGGGGHGHHGGGKTVYGSKKKKEAGTYKLEMWGHGSAMQSYAEGSASMSKGLGNRKLDKLRPYFGAAKLSRDQLPALSQHLTKTDENGDVDEVESARSRAWFASTIGNGSQAYVINHKGALVAAVPQNKPDDLATAMQRVLQVKWLEQAEAELAGKEGKNGPPNLKTLRKLANKIDDYPLKGAMRARLGEIKNEIRQRGNAAQELKLARRLHRRDPAAARPRLESIISNYPDTDWANQAAEILARDELASNR